MTRYLVAFVKFCCYLNLIALSQVALGSDSFIIEKIQIEGLERLDDGTLLNYLPVQVGDPLDQKQVSYAIRELYKTGFFANVALLRDGGTLIVKVHERPSISEVNFSGNSDIDDDTLEDALSDIGIQAGRIYNRTLLEKLSHELEKVYFSQGKYGVRIETEVEELDQNRVAIDIDISEGAIALIKHINIIGNNAFDNDTLLDELNLGVPSAWAILSSADEYSKPKLNADLETLRSYYLDRGYLKFKITSTQVSITPDKKDIYITVNIEEGDLYTVSDYVLMGETVLEPEVLEQHVAYDIGTHKLIAHLSRHLDAPAVLAGYSRLVVDLNRSLEDSSVIPARSDHIRIPGNQDLSPQQRALRIHCFYTPYRVTVDRMLHRFRERGIVPAFISIHSFTPQLADNQHRPWNIGLMWDKDPRIPVPLLENLRAHTHGINVGDNKPYSGKHVADYTIDHHAESAGLPHVSIETRQDLVNTEEGAEYWANILDESLRDILADPDLYRLWDN